MPPTLEEDELEAKLEHDSGGVRLGLRCSEEDFDRLCDDLESCSVNVEASFEGPGMAPSAGDDALVDFPTLFNFGEMILASFACDDSACIKKGDQTQSILMHAKNKKNLSRKNTHFY